MENYKNFRFLKFIYTHPFFWIAWSQRQALVWTSKAKVLYLVSTLIYILMVCASTFFLFSDGVSSISKWLVLCVIIVLTIAFIPLYFVITHLLLSPIDTYLKNQIISKAKSKIAALPKLKVIAITGSYGKTSTKEIIKTLLDEKYKVVTPDGNKNTPLWISETIMKKLDETSEVCIVEMWAYERWNIKELCDLVWGPDISILTGITIQHLERFGSLENIQDTKFEIIDNVVDNGTVIIDISSTWAQWAYENKKATIKTTDIITLEKPTNYTFLPNFQGLEFQIDEITYQTKLIAPHSINAIKIAVICALKLWLTQEQIQSGIKKITYVPHRMEVLKNPKGLTIIDDSYNGNIEWVNSIVQVLEKTPFSWRKVIIAGWVVELWIKLSEVNQKIGELFSKVAQLVLIAKGPVWESIAKWLILAGFEEKNIKIYETGLDIHKDLPNVLQNTDVVVFQNDLPDNYL